MEDHVGIDNEVESGFPVELGVVLVSDLRQDRFEARETAAEMTAFVAAGNIVSDISFSKYLILALPSPGICNRLTAQHLAFRSLSKEFVLRQRQVSAGPLEDRDRRM